MKVIFDANVLISYLLTSENVGNIVKIVEAGFVGKYELVLPPEVLSEIRKKLREKAFLSRRIDTATSEKFISALRAIAYTPHPITEAIPEVGRDLKDDFLIAYGTIEECDYLITGDDDLHVLGSIGTLHIVSPKDFCTILYPPGSRVRKGPKT